MRRLLILCALIAGPTILVGPALLPGRALLPADLLLEFEPWRSQPGEARPQAHWDALVWDGIAYFYPARQFAAESLRSGVIPLWNPYQFCGSPFQANAQSAVLYPPNLLFLLLPVTSAFGWSAWLHLCLTGWLMYRLLRRIGVGRAGAACGSVVWQLNGFMVAWIHLPVALCTIAWLPGVLLMCERALLARRLRFALAAGIGLALSCLGGHPQMFLYVGMMTGAYLIARGASRAQGAVPQCRLLRLLWVGATAAAVGLGLAAAQLLPSVDLLRVSHRAVAIGPHSYQAYLGRALQPVQLLNLLLPHPFGHPALGTYAGPENYADYCLYIGLPALAIATFAPLSCRNWHARFFALAALAALLIAMGTALNWPLYRWIPGMASAGGPARMVVLCVFSLAVLVGTGAERLFGLAQRAGRAGWAAWPRRAAAPLLAVILAGDLLLAARHHVHIVPGTWAYPPMQALSSPPDGRLLTTAADWPLRGQFPHAVLPPNAATVYHLREVGGYDALYLARYRDFASLIQGGDPSPPANGNMILFRLGPQSRPEMARLAAARTYVALARDGRAVLLPDEEAFPRAWVTSSAVSLPTRREAVAALANLGPTRDCVVITGEEEPAAPASPSAHARVADLSPNAVEVSLTGGGGYLFLADSCAPGWHAYAHGGTLRVMPADVTFRAVSLPPEARKVVFRYEPASFRVGLFVSLVGVAMVMGAGAGSWARSRSGI